MGPSRSCWNDTTSVLLRKGLEFHMCTINKSAHTKRSLETYCVLRLVLYGRTGFVALVPMTTPTRSTGKSNICYDAQALVDSLPQLSDLVSHLA